jgi:hypothetical protein
MTSEEKQRFIHLMANEHEPELNERVYWSLHALRKLRSDRLRKSAVEECLKHGMLIEDYDLCEGRALPGCL